MQDCEETRVAQDLSCPAGEAISGPSNGNLCGVVTRPVTKHVTVNGV